MVGGSTLEPSLDPCQFRAEAVLLFLEQIGGYGVLVVELEELALLVLQVVSGCLELRDALPLLGGREGDFLAQVPLFESRGFVGIAGLCHVSRNAETWKLAA